MTEEEDRRAILIEATRRWGNNGLYTRAELVDVETSLLLIDSSAPEEHVPGVSACARRPARWGECGTLACSSR